MSVQPSGNPELIAFIRSEIANHGPVSFKWFMDKCLYHPQYGYYAQNAQNIGRHGDFYTNVSVSHIFGELMAKQFEEMWQRMGCPEAFAIVEQGAHSGQFANDVMTWIQHFAPEFYEAVRYWLVEPSKLMQEAQEELLKKWPKNRFRWIETLTSVDVGSIVGVHFSNELIDAFPVHLVSYVSEGWYENFVDIEGKGRFKFVYGPPSNHTLEKLVAKLPDVGVQHYRTEINAPAQRWIEDLSKMIGRGYVLSVDYGYPRSVFYSTERSDGTLCCYHKHRRHYDPFHLMGECDITAHVDFTSLAEAAETLGMQVAGFTDQHHFMIGAGEEDLLNLETSPQIGSPEFDNYIRSFKALMHPSTMGMAFKFLCFSKNVEDTEPLMGFRYAGDYRKALEISEKPPELDPYAAF